MTASALTIPVIASAAILTNGKTEEWLHLSPAVFIMTRHCLHDALSTLSGIPNMVMLSKLAPRGSEGPFFAVFGNVNDVGMLFNGAVSAAALTAFGVTSTNFSNLSNLIYASSALNVLVAPWSIWTPESTHFVANAEPEVEREEEMSLINNDSLNKPPPSMNSSPELVN